MVDAPLSPHESLGSRIKDVETLQDTLDLGGISALPFELARGRRFQPTGGVAPFITTDDVGSVTLVRPESIPFAIMEKKWSFDIGKSGVDCYFAESCAVDIAQDLLVVTTLELGA